MPQIKSAIQDRTKKLTDTPPATVPRCASPTAGSVQRLVRLFFCFLFDGFFESGVNLSETEEINSFCRFGNGCFSVIKNYPKIKVRVERKKSIFAVLFRNDVCRLILKRLFVVPLANLFNAKNNPSVGRAVV